MTLRLPFPLSAQVSRSNLGIITENEEPAWVILYEECLEGYKIDRPSGLPTNALEIVTGGSGRIHLEGSEKILRAGNYFFYRPQEAIRFESSGLPPLRKYFLAALRAEVWQRHWFGRMEQASLAVLEDLDLVPRLLERLLRLTREHGNSTNEAARTLLETVGVLLYRSQETNRRAHRQDALLSRALRHLEKHLLEISTVNEWANALEVSPNHLCRIFQQHHHKTPYAELIDRKLHHAYHLLSTGAGNVGQIAHRVGFNDPFHFSRVFRKRMGMPPSQLLRHIERRSP